MKFKLTIFFCVLAILSLLGYEWFIKTGKLTGQVFVVTKGSGNIKLGLVEVSAIPESDVMEYIEKKRKFISSEKIRISRELDTHYVESLELGNKAIYEVREAFLKLDNKEEFDRNDLLKKTDGLKLELQKKNSKIYSLKFDLKKLNNKSADFFYSDFPDTRISKALTDADGKFSLEIPSHGKFAIAAHSSRQVLDITEEYYWLVWVSLDGENSKNIILSNNNFMTSNSPESVVSNDLIVSY